MTVAIQGEPGSFHDIAARQYYGQEIELVCCATFKQVFEALTSGSADAACVAIENSLYGSINEVYDLLMRYHSWIQGEVFLRIEHNLIGLAGATPELIKEVYSHPVALAQCEAYLDGPLARAERFEHHDTAGAVADILRWQDPTKAAIASKEAARIHGLSVLKDRIETNKHNYTRFMMLAPRKRAQPKTTKTSIVLEAANTPGALYQVLGIFAKHSINLTKLESRPILGQAWHYMFYLDFDAGLHHAQSAIQEIEQKGNNVTVLGTYQAGIMPSA